MQPQRHRLPGAVRGKEQTGREVEIFEPKVERRTNAIVAIMSGNSGNSSQCQVLQELPHGICCSRRGDRQAGVGQTNRQAVLAIMSGHKDIQDSVAAWGGDKLS